ncbi:MAG: hypothetical protein AB1468_03890 [Candidatus Micrarchaeota archaeon]
MRYETLAVIGLTAFVLSFAYFGIGWNERYGCGFSPFGMMSFGASSVMFGVLVLLLAVAAWLALVGEGGRKNLRKN